MSNLILRRKAIQLRLKGKTYSEIVSELRIPKSTLSGWLTNFPLSKKQISLLEKNRKLRKLLSIEKTRNTKQRKREERLNLLYQKEEKKWQPLSKRELDIAGIFLYWGEGNKRINGPISVNNTDPSVMKFVLYWMKNILGVSSKKIKVHLHLYKDVNVKREMIFWSNELKIPLSSFTKPYIKENTTQNIDQKGFGHGTCGLAVSNVRLKEKIMTDTKVIADRYSKRI